MAQWCGILNKRSPATLVTVAFCPESIPPLETTGTGTDHGTDNTSSPTGQDARLASVWSASRPVQHGL